jgi:polar amino acid transport system substrate-binding protein
MGFAARAVAALGLALICVTAPLHAQEAQQPGGLRVVTRELAPFVMRDGDKYKGFSAELWDAIAKELGKPYQFVPKDNVKEILAAVAAGEGDVAIAAISITEQREEQFDFSQPMFESGLQIMVRNDGGGGLAFAQIWALLTSPAMMSIIGVLALAILIPAHIAWYLERNRDNHLFPRSYFPGILHAMYWATGAVSGQSPDVLLSGLGRLLAAVLIIGSLFFTSYFTATIATSLTVAQLRSDINGPGDLVGKKVGTAKGSTSETYLSAIGAEAVTFNNIEGAEQALLAKEVDAVMYDAPVLLYYASTQGQGKVHMAGDMVRKENYGILFPRGSDLRKPVNEALLKLRENGVYDSLYAKWFGASQGGP